MDFSASKIRDLTDAKLYFTSMGCSSFHMSREHPDRYAEYVGLQIPKSTEHEWRREVFNEGCKVLCDDKTENSTLWSSHSYIADLCRYLETAEAVREFHLSTEKIIDRLPSRGKLLVAETLVGRSAAKGRSGLIFHASKHGMPQIAERLYEIATNLIESCRDSGVEIKRCQDALDHCTQIRDDLEPR